MRLLMLILIIGWIIIFYSSRSYGGRVILIGHNCNNFDAQPFSLAVRLDHFGSTVLTACGLTIIIISYFKNYSYRLVD